jgi:hypothetical protein
MGLHLSFLANFQGMAMEGAAAMFIDWNIAAALLLSLYNESGFTARKWYWYV